MSDQPFDSPLLLIGAAEKDINEVKAFCESFTKSCEYAVIKHFDAKTKETVIRLRLKDAIPGTLRVQVSRVINDLRHALDQAVCDGSVMLGAASATDTYFPFGSDATNFPSMVKKNCRKVRQDLLDFIVQFKPYYGGDDILWALNRMTGRNKHQRLLGVTPESKGLILRAEGLNIKGPMSFTPHNWNDTRNQLEFARIGEGGHLEMQLDIPLQIVIGTADVVGGQPLHAVLDQFLSKAKGIVFGIKAETARLAAVP